MKLYRKHYMDDREHTDMPDTEFHSSVDVENLLAGPEPLINRIAEVPEALRDDIEKNPDMRVIEVSHSDFEAPVRLTPANEIMDELTHNGTTAADASRANQKEGDVENQDQGKFAALFGRDSIKIAKLLRDKYPQLMRNTVLSLAKYQSTEDKPMADQEEGKIPHEVRLPGDKIAAKLTAERGWEWPYYGSADSTPNFISLLSAAVEDGQLSLDDTVELDGKEARNRTMRESLDAALNWLTTNQDKGKFGLIEYRRRNPNGIENQILRDSPDSMSDKSGRIANHNQPIASLQAQSEAYDAYLNAAEMFENESQRTNNPELQDRAQDLRRRAKHLHDQVIEKFYIEDERGGFFAVGIDYDDEGTFQRLDTRTNDMAYLLSSRLLTGVEEQDKDSDKGKVAKLVATLESDEMKVGSGGLRSLSKQEVNFRKAAYHNGSDWLVADIEYAEGLRQHGYSNEAVATYEWIIEACESTHAYPEYVMGGDSETPEVNDIKVVVSTSKTSNQENLNTLMQPPEMGQGWSVAAYLLAKQRLSELLGQPETEQELEEESLVA